MTAALPAISRRPGNLKSKTSQSRASYVHERTMMKVQWQGVFPAITTQMFKDGSIDLEGTARHAEALIASGVKGLIFLGSLGENQTLTASEKRLTMEAMVKA
ncbi:MAG: dihydrodipicolinate synthase family protein, partial [Pirellulaceae bacterium]